MLGDYGLGIPAKRLSLPILCRISLPHSRVSAKNTSSALQMLCCLSIYLLIRKELGLQVGSSAENVAEHPVPPQCVPSGGGRKPSVYICEGRGPPEERFTQP